MLTANLTRFQKLAYTVIPDNAPNNVPNQERIALLVEALRSGEYSQTTSLLKRYAFYSGPDGVMSARHCCLGVACEVAIANGLNLTETTNKRHMGVRFNTSETNLPDEVMNWYGFTTRDPDLLVDIPKWWQFWRRPTRTRATGANDFLRLNFAQIADAFEWTYLKKNKNRKKNK